MSKEELLAHFEQEYIRSGYIYSGSIPMNATIFHQNKGNLDKAFELVAEGKLEHRNSESRSFQFPISRRKELIEKNNLAEEWEKGDGRVFYPNGPYGEVTSAYGRTKEVLKRIALDQLHQNEHGWYAYFKSSSGHGTYMTQYWEENHKQFRAGQITCNCKGWIFNKKCRHQDEMQELLLQAEIISA